MGGGSNAGPEPRRAGGDRRAGARTGRTGHLGVEQRGPLQRFGRPHHRRGGVPLLGSSGWRRRQGLDPYRGLEHDVLVEVLLLLALGAIEDGGRGPADRWRLILLPQLHQPAAQLGLARRAVHAALGGLQVHQHLFSGLVAIGRRLLHGPLDHPGDLRGQLRLDLPGRGELALLDPQDDLQVGRRLEWPAAREHQVQHRPHREQVRPGVQLPARGLLGRHEGQLALDDALTGALTAAQRLGDAEVGELHLAVLADEDVVRTDVPVNDPQRLAVSSLGVGIVQGPAHLGAHVQRHLRRQRELRLAHPGDDLIEVPAINQLQHQVVPSLGMAEVQHLDDVAVVQAHGDVSLVHDHVLELRVGQQRRQDLLEHHPALEPLGAVLGGQENLRHPSVGDLAQLSVTGRHSWDLGDDHEGSAPTVKVYW